MATNAENYEKVREALKGRPGVKIMLVDSAGEGRRRRSERQGEGVVEVVATTDQRRAAPLPSRMEPLMKKKMLT